MDKLIDDLIKLAFAEDIGDGDADRTVDAERYATHERYRYYDP